MDPVSILADALAPLFTVGKSKIIFMCDPHTIPWEVVQYLESFGIRCVPKHHVQIQKNGCRTVEIYVSNAQYLWAAKLAAGYGVTVLQPLNISSVKPSTRWGVTRHHNGIAATILRAFAGFFGVQATLAPKKPKLGKSKPNNVRSFSKRPKSV